MSTGVIAITMGDPAGISPEIIVKACTALSAKLEDGSLRLAILGSSRALRTAEAMLGMKLPLPRPISRS